MITKKRFNVPVVRQVRPEHSGSPLMKQYKLERLIAGEKIKIEHEDKARRSIKKPQYGYAPNISREGILGRLSTGEFRELNAREVEKNIETFNKFIESNEIKQKLAGIKRMIYFAGIESNVWNGGGATAITRKLEKIARMRGVDAIYCSTKNKNMESILGKGRWQYIGTPTGEYNYWVRFLK